MEQMKIIGWVRTDFPEKFGAPRQSGFCGSVRKASGMTGVRRSNRRGWAATGAWVCLQHARRFAQTPSDFPVSGWSRSVWMEKRHRT